MTNERDPRKAEQAKAGDVLLPKYGYQAPLLITSIIDAGGNWQEVNFAQPYCGIQTFSFREWNRTMETAEVIYRHAE